MSCRKPYLHRIICKDCGNVVCLLIKKPDMSEDLINRHLVNDNLAWVNGNFYSRISAANNDLSFCRRCKGVLVYNSTPLNNGELFQFLLRLKDIDELVSKLTSKVNTLRVFSSAGKLNLDSIDTLVNALLPIKNALSALHVEKENIDYLSEEVGDINY